jgi:peptidoglycan hydrolase CwlO-like protein
VGIKNEKNEDFFDRYIEMKFPIAKGERKMDELDKIIEKIKKQFDDIDAKIAAINAKLKEVKE